MMALKAAVEPMLMSPITMLKMEATITARTGIEVAGWTCRAGINLTLILEGADAKDIPY